LAFFVIFCGHSPVTEVAGTLAGNADAGAVNVWCASV
jgi:hypothetical protein